MDGVGEALVPLGECRNVLLLCAVRRGLEILETSRLPNTSRIVRTLGVSESRRNFQLPQEHGRFAFSFWNIIQLI